MKKALKIIKQISISLCCLFLFTQCDEVRYIDEADIPKIKPGGAVQIAAIGSIGVQPRIKLISNCDLLGVRQHGSLNGKTTYRADFQTINKSEDLLLTVQFVVDSLITPDSATCDLIDISGTFKQNNKTYSLDFNKFNNEFTKIGFSNLSIKGKQSNFRLTSRIRSDNDNELWVISFQSILLP